MQKNLSHIISKRLLAGALPAILALSALAPPVFAEEPLLKPAVPQMDETPIEKPKTPLQAGVEHNVNKSAAAPVKRKPKKIEAKIDLRDLFNGRMRAGALDGELGGGRFNINTERGIGIIGVRFLSMIGQQPVINTVFDGTPAAKVGVRPDDIIVAVDGVPTHGLTRDECYELIVGTPNTPVTLSLRRNGSFFVRTMTRMDFLDIRDPRVQQAYKAGI